ncbi:PSME3-interacting protein [Nematostella vectensis]|uniref:PSME3-interacting protein n=1 Tax=Nematostella vectensis TaxID=45351 RepID=UPI00207787A4|nr:PSME3-interacting protein [Nematostella vectensis]
MSGGGGLKSFVSETEAEEIRKKRQEEWEKVRKPDDPIERPEAEVDNRTLYEKLQEQKDKKQEEWEEQHKFKNLFRGIDGDEAEFLDLVSKQQQELKKKLHSEENKELDEFRSAVSDLQSSSAPVEQSKVNSGRKQPLPGPAKKSQAALISGAIKRKSSFSDKSSPVKKTKTEETNNETEVTQESTNASVNSNDNGDSQPKSHPKVLVPRCRLDRTGPNVRQTLTIPGLGIYSDSSDSESSSSDSEIGSSSTNIRV